MNYALDSSDLYGRSPFRRKLFYVIPALIFLFWSLCTLVFGFQRWSSVAVMVLVAAAYPGLLCTSIVIKSS